MPTATYDDEKEDLQQPVADGSHDDLGTPPEQRDQEVSDLQDLYNAESAPKQEASTPADQKEESKLDDQVGKGYTSDGKGGDKSGKSKSSRNKRGVAGIVSVIIVTGSVGMLGILQGPFQLVHAAQLLQRFHFLSDEEFMDGRAGQLIKYMRHRRAPQRRNLGAIGNKIADRYETKLKNAGIEARYDSGRSGRISSLTFRMDNPKAVQALKEIEARGGTITGMDDGKVTVDVGTSSGGTRSRRGVVKGVVHGLGLGKVSSAVGSRTMTRRAGVDFHPLKNIARTGDEKLFNYLKKIRDERNNRRRNGVDAQPVGDTTTDTDDPEKAREDAMDNGRTDVPDGSTSLENKLKKILGDTGKALMAIAILCAVQSMNDTIEESMQTLVVLPLIRMGTELVAMGNQVMDGKDVNFDELGATATQFYDEAAEVGGKSFFSAASVQAELGEEVTGPDMPDAARPSGEKPEFFKMVDRIIDGIPLPGGVASAAIKSACKVATNFWTGVIVDGVLGVLSGGALTALLQVGGGLAQDQAVSYFADDLARWFSSKPVAINASGALLGNYANYGAFLASNESAIAHGAGSLTPTQVAELKTEEREIQLAKTKQKNPFDRYLNLYDADSLVSRGIIQNESISSPTATVASIFKAPLSLFSGFGSLISRTVSPKAFAQDSESYDYGVPKYGFSQADAENEIIDDPYENAEWVESRLSSLNDKYSKCFGTKIDPTTFKIQDLTNGKGVKYHDLKRYEDDCGYGEKQNTSTEFLRYRVYLADQYAAKSLACYEGVDEEACEEIGFVADGGGSGQASGSMNDGSGSGESSVTPGEISSDSSATPCADGTTDLGIRDDAYHNGERIKIRLCAVTSISTPDGSSRQSNSEVGGAGLTNAMVSSIVSEAWQKLGEKFEQDNGRKLVVGSSWRTMSHQQALCNDNENCKNGTSYSAVAKPGTSNHQAGTAMDLAAINSSMPEVNGSKAASGRTCSNPQVSSSSDYTWMVANAKNFGIKNYANEAWHWGPSEACAL